MTLLNPPSQNMHEKQLTKLAIFFQGVMNDTNLTACFATIDSKFFSPFRKSTFCKGSFSSGIPARRAGMMSDRWTDFKSLFHSALNEPLQNNTTRIPGSWQKMKCIPMPGNNYTCPKKKLLPCWYLFQLDGDLS